MNIKRFLLILPLCAFLTGFIYAQNSAQFGANVGVSLETEIKKLESASAKQGITALERHAALVNLARLRQLSGDIEGAARNWLEAAAVVPGQVDDEALLSCAYCLAAMGEWDRAAAALDPLAAKNIRASFLSVCINAIKTKDLSELGSLADNPAYTEIKPGILFVLWKLSAKEGSGSSQRWRQRLVNEFPQTPEGKLAANNSSSITVSPTPFWLFINGLDSLPLQSVSEQTTLTPTVTVRLQTGIFSSEENARNHAALLRKAGFDPSIEKRAVSSSAMWAVTVPADSDQMRTVNNLRMAGFDSFLVK